MFGFKSSQNDLLKILPQVRGKYLKNVLLSRHTWFHVGGPAEIMYIPEDEDDLCLFMKTKPYNLPVCVLGGGSNVLIRDGGIPGVVIKLSSKYFKHVKIGSESITCFAGVRNPDLQKTFIDNKIGGLEFLCSIPGVIGGSIKTNAGCFGKSIKDVILSATIVDGTGEKYTVGPEDLMLSYRNSFFPDDWIITSVTFKTETKPAPEIARTIDEQKLYRKQNQPYNERTAGSTFKNPDGLKAWELIKKAGCDKLQINGAKVSEKHCNFLINTGHAKASDLEELGYTIVERVKKATSITLEWEIKRMGIPSKK